jgi:signal transduction histidine kinase
VRDLAVLHDGRAWVEPNPGGGSRFIVELRASTSREAPPVESTAPAIIERV